MRLRSTEPATVLLAAASGSLDALAFLALGQVFASVMTGNLVLLAIALQRGDAAQAQGTGVAFGGYVAGALVGGLLARSERHPHAPRGMWLELALVLALAIGWEVADGDPGGYLAPRLLLVLAAAAMGVQSVLSGHLPGGASTTYFTGTLTGVIADLGQHRRLRSWPAVRLVALVAGAFLSALLLEQAPRYAVTVPVVGVAMAAAMLLRAPADEADGDELTAG